MNVEKINMYAENFSGYYKPSNDEIEKNNQSENKEVPAFKEENNNSSNISYNFSSPVKIYAESVIKNAVRNIEKGLDVEENKKIIQLYSNILKENPEKILRNKFYI